ncbi:hypothetical protein B7P43_G00856 [Cryptotermes secundus]|uniref:Endonuclease/exonuclease/phosphatase domain-containing protein n=1 Tax=Cryptotermes secundus TaxID=105785 RepID=A0A2J7PK68_9NEOP|nr:hypothetical protein B7P43_G00856 [Cryptotermes secundus]
MRFRTWNVRIMYRAGSLRAVAVEIPKYNLDLVGIHDFRWDGVDIEPCEYNVYFKLTTGNESLHEISNGNAVRVENFATSKNLTVKSIMFPHRNIHKFTWPTPDGKIHNQIDHILIHRRRHSSMLDVRSFTAADCDTDHYLVVANARERLAVNK